MPRALSLLVLLLASGCCAGWDDPAPAPRRGPLDELPPPPPGRYSVVLERLEYSSADALEVEVLWRYAAGGVEVGTPGAPGGGGLSAKVRALERSGRLRSAGKSFVMAGEGENARLAVGSEGLSVRVRRSGKEALLEVWSVAPGLGLRTQALLRNGEPLPLGGLETAREGTDRGLFGGSGASSSRRSLLLATVRWVG